MCDSPGGDAGCFGDLTRWDPGADRGTRRPIPGLSGLLLCGDGACQFGGCVGDLVELATFVGGRGSDVHLLHAGAGGSW